MKTKRIISLLLATCLILCCMPLPSLAQDNRITFTQKPIDLFTFEKIQVTAQLGEVAKSQGKAAWKFDGTPIEGYSNPSFSVEPGKSSTLTFVVPQGLHLGSDHTISFSIELPDGQLIEQTETLWLNSYTPYLHVDFTQPPSVAEEGADAWFGFRFDLEHVNRTFCVPVRATVNGEPLWEYCRTIDIQSGTEDWICIPGVGPNGSSMKLEYVANPEGIWGVDQWSARADVRIVNTAYEQKVADVLSKIQPVIIPASTVRATTGYADSGMTRAIGSLPQGEPLTYLNPDSGYSMKSALVKTRSGRTYWVPMQNLYVSSQNFTITDNLSFEEKELFVNARGYASKSHYLVWVNLQRQTVNVYLGNQGNWKILKTFPCATGKNNTPTPTDEFEYTSLTTMWKFDHYYCAPVLNLRNGYAFHSQPTRYDGRVYDATMGRPASLGCIRLYAGDVTWMRDYIPVGTKVVVY